MLKRSIVLRLRALWRNRTHAAINIVGLSLGITSAIAIFLILQFELSYDEFREDNDRIYRVVWAYEGEGYAEYTSSGNYVIVPTIREDFPDVEQVSLVDSENAVILITRTNGQVDKFRESSIVFIDPSYFDIMQEVWLKGDRQSLLKPHTVVLTKRFAEKYFGDEDPINKTINYNSEFDLSVTGVIENPAQNTDFNFGIYVNNDIGTGKRGWDSWGASSSDVNCILKLHNGVTREQMEAKMKGWHVKYFKDKEEAMGRNYMLQPLAEVHFDENYDNPGGRIISKKTLITLGLIGVVLLLTACVNFINLNTVLIGNRSREAGVRKVMGSTRLQLVAQFIGETVIITMMSILISAGLVELLLIKLSPVLGYKLEFHPFTDIATTTYLIIILVVVTALAGLYPAMKLSRFQPIKALKNRIGGEPQSGITLRRSLIVFQLIISQVLIVCTIIVVQQIDHFMAQPLGLKHDAVLEFQIPERNPEIMNRLSERMRQIPGVVNFTASNTGSISSGQWNGGVDATVNGKLIKETAVAKIADENYLATYGITLLAGENLVKSDTATRFLVNEKLCQALGYTDYNDAIGTPLNFWGKKAIITGVVNDFNAKPLQEKVMPTLIFCDANSYFKGAVLLSTAGMTKTLPAIKEVWEDVFPKYVYEKEFLDVTIDHFYDGERKVSYLIGMFASVAIFIGSIGLFGLISFMARQKTKEIGIRKTLGATVGQVVGLFSKEFAILIAISFAMFVPITYYFMDQWLSNFEYRIQPGFFTFILGAGFIGIIVFATVGLKSYKAATANPVDALRDE